MPLQQSSHVVSAPFIKPQQTISAVMRQVIYAMVPGMAVAFYFFGWGVISNLIIACASALAWESLALFLRKRPIKNYLADGSAVVTAILLGLALPPMAPWWLLLVGTFFAIVVAKQLYGGLGYNALNPAMAGYAVLLISFPREMSAWVAPVTLPMADIGFIQTLHWVFLHQLPGAITFDALTSATPLDYMRTEIGRGVSFNEVRLSATVGVIAGKGIEWINLAILLGGIWLWYKKLITWHIPAMVLTSIAVLSGAFYLYAPERFADPVFHCFSGATMLCAFFIATDPVTASTTPMGKIIYGLGVGCLIYIIRTWGGYPDAVAFAVLLMNFTAPLLDQYTVPRIYGAGQRKG
ncbi:MAG: electron transport complex subunit RsxD [Gammaproteobacteria bacterium]|jgi:electron transport complex protein RnfD|nr:electron transport complex subunit RsxD [Gammaproteobacteria bacterium]